MHEQSIIHLREILGTGHYLAGGEGYYVWGEGHNFFSLTLGRAIFLKMPLRGGLRFF